jgi:copper chaperone NosL
MKTRGARLGGTAAIVAIAASIASSSCARGPLPPASLDTKNEACAFCRMGVVDRRFAAQLVAPGEEPKFFDDIGCLRDYLARRERVWGLALRIRSRGRSWVPAAGRLYRAPTVQTPMDSGLMAHVDAQSREQDPDALGGTPMTAADVFGARGAPGGTR